MKHFTTKALSWALALLMLIQVCPIAVFAENEAEAFNPAEQMTLTVPERFQDGGSWFFIPEQGYAASETSAGRIYIPIQRTGDLAAEADVTLKVTDISAKHDVNYKVEIYKEDVDPAILLDDLSILDLIQNADGQEEYEPIADENEFGEIIHAVGEAELVDENGNVLGTVTATPLDENGNPIEEADEQTETAPVGADDHIDPDAAGDAQGEVEEGDWTEPESAKSAVDLLRAGRDAFTGTTSDRQELEGGDLYDFNPAGVIGMSDEEFDQEMADAAQEEYPGKEYTLHFGAGEEAKFLVITPLYSEAAEGDAQLMLMLKNPSEGWAIGEDVNPVSVTIYDVDEPEEVTVSMAVDTVYAKDGKASITVTREGRLNAIKGVTLASWNGSAKEGDEYSGIGAKLYFPVGITSRTVEIPVYHGLEEKDFYVSITALSDETVELATTHVIIPAAEAESDGALMGIDNVNGHPYTGAINIKGGWFEGGSGNGFDSDTAFHLSTRADKEETAKLWLDTSKYGYAYDGLYLQYEAFLNWCDGEFRLVHWINGQYYHDHVNSFDDGGMTRDHWLYAAWGAPKARDLISIEGANVDNEGPAWTDSYISMWVNDVHLIKRQFSVYVEDPEVKPLLGVSDEDVLRDYEAVFLDGKQQRTRTLWTDEAFSVSVKNEKNPLRLAGLEAKTADGKWVRIVTLDGSSQLANVTLNQETINALAAKNVFTWSVNGSCDHGGNFYKGSITVRPVFEYIDVTVELKAHDYGTLSMTAPNPSLLWDFNADNAMNSKMGVNWVNQVSWGGASSGSDSYYTFHVSGGDPYVSMETPIYNASDIRWVKVRARTSGSGNKLELFASCGGAGRSIGNTNFQLTLQNDGQWHEYVFAINNANWRDNVQWLRLDPLANCQNGDSIDIDYVAFFADENSARAYRSGADTVSAIGTYTYHLEDRIDFGTTLTQAGRDAQMSPDGVYYELRRQSRTGELINHDDPHYINGSWGYEMTGKDSRGNVVDKPWFSFVPTFTQDQNRVTVRITDYYYNNYLDTTQGLFAPGSYVSMEHKDGWYEIVIAKDVLTNDLYELTASTKNPGSVIPKWILADGSEFFGDTLYLLSAPHSDNNVVTLQAATGSHLTWTVLTGTVTTSTMNLSTGRTALDAIPVANAYVACGMYATWTDENGCFSLPAMFYDSEAVLRFTVTYNGMTTIHEAGVPAKNAPKTTALTLAGQSVQAVTANAGVVKVNSFSDTGAHFASVSVEQDNILVGTVNGLIMNGGMLIVEVQVAQGEQYLLNGERLDEHITDVTLYFQDRITGEIHGLFSSNTTPSQNSPARWSYNKNTGIFTLRINQFDPAHPTEWTYGDVLMAQLTTDKKVALSAWDEAQPMCYDPVSTGIAVYADPDYEPQTFDYDIENVASMLGIEPQTDEDGNLLDDENTRYSFGSFPYIGEITAAVHVFSRVASSATCSAEMDSLMADLDVMASGEDWDDDDDDGGSGESSSNSAGGAVQNYTLNILVKIDETAWGGVRFMFGVIISTGGGQGYTRQRNPYQNINNFIAANQFADQYNAMASASDFVVADRKIPKGRGNLSEYGGAYFKFSAFVGFYLDYGYVEISTDNGAEVSHDMVFMGAGGFIGFGGSVGYTWAFMAGPVPMYVNVEAGLNLTFFIGSEGNPQKTLQSFKTDKEMHGQDFQFNFEFKGRVYVTGCIGVGLYKVLGVRISVTVAFEAGYGNNITDWYPNLFDSGWGYVTECTFTGTLDLMITSIDFYSATWPLPLADGFLYYFQETRRANKCIGWVEAAIQKGEGSASARATAQQMCNELKALVDTNELLSAAGENEKPNLASADTIKEKTYALREYAYDEDIINWTTYNAIHMNKQGGIIGAIINATTEGEEDEGLRYHTNDHVNPQWVANDGSLMAAFGNASSRTLVEDAYNQPSSKILSIGGGRYLLVFLSDDASRDRMAASALTWTIYDENTDQWTEPQTVPGDHIADSRPNLVDAGDKVVLSWAAIPEQSYQALKDAFRAELTEAVGTEPTDKMLQEAMEEDPARVMSAYEIYSVEFYKTSASFADPVRLTDDAYYDDYPQAVYDALTGDYIILYNKTAQDDEAYDDPGDKLQDLVAASPDPEKTYSVICYLIHNAEADVNAGQKDDSGELYTVPAGWVTEYLYEGELNAESLASYGGTAYYLSVWHGQRFMPSTIRNEDGTYADPPITDLTVAPGRNGIATYAFTVDQDFNLNTAEDRELFVEFYNFETHGVYVPVRVGGSVTEEKEYYVADADQFVTLTSEKQVEVGTPRLIRNGRDTFLFWRENGQSLRYLNITQMLNEKVAAVANPSDGNETDWTYAVKDDGSFATDAVTGLTYEPRVMKLELASALTDETIEITDYEVITDAEDNLYVVWTDTVTTDVTNEAGESYPVAAQEIFASAMIQQENGTVRWSKPYRLTRDNAFNDGLALALDSEGGLIIVHNQYTKQTAQSEEEIYTLIEQGKIGLTQDKEGNLYAASLSYNSPVNLMVTRLDKVGSLEATAFEFSDAAPVAGETVAVTAAIENVGLTDAEGSQIDFYASKNGVRGELIQSFTSEETIQVNTARQVRFRWTIPADGPDGYCIEAVIREQKADGSYYDAVSSFSDAFAAAPYYAVKGKSITQEGDQFRVQFTAANKGNLDAAEGTTLSVRLAGLYGDLNSDRYGNLTTNVLYSEEVSSKLTAKTLRDQTELDAYALPQATVYEGDVLVDIPTSVFRYCGYDAIQIVLTDRAGNVLVESDQLFVTMDAPMHLRLNDGNDLSLNSGDSMQVGLDYDTTVFIDAPSVVYSVEDPRIAVVDEDGNVTGLSEGTTTLTATILPSGSSVTITVKVGSNVEDCPKDDSCPLSAFTDLDMNAWYHDGVHWALTEGAMAGTSATTFSPTTTATRAMLVTILWSLEGAPEPESNETTFTDLKANGWYRKAVLWASQEELTAGTSATTFSPNQKLTREQLAVFLRRYAEYKGADVSASADLSGYTDKGSISGYAQRAVKWAVAVGIIGGTSQTTLSPKESASRTQIATMLWRLCTNVISQIE